MLKTLRGARAREGWRLLTSWMKVFSAEVRPQYPKTLDALKIVVRAGNYSCVGTSHSYNGVQIVSGTDAVIFSESSLNEKTYDDTAETVTVGPSVTVRELKLFLRDQHQRRLVNSGNYMAQTVVGALMGGTHGYGDRGVMAGCVTALTFLDGRGEPHTLRKGDQDFPYAALSFGVIAPIISVTLSTAPLEGFQSDLWICRLSDKAAHAEGAMATSFAVMPYSRLEDPLILLHTLRTRPSTKSLEPVGPEPSIAQFIISRYWFFDRLFPSARRLLQRRLDRLNPSHHQQRWTDPQDLDYLYDPDPMLESERPPSILRGFFSTTHTAYNLAFFVPLEQAPEVLRFIMHEAEELRSLGFYLKSLIGVRELPGRSDLPFAGNFGAPMAAIDLFSDVRDYAWLERLQRDVLAYFPGVRPHWGKSAIVDEWRASLGDRHLERLRELHRRHYPDGSLQLPERVRRLLGLYAPAPGTEASAARMASLRR